MGGMIYAMLDVGVIITLFIYLVIGADFAEKKMYWWLMIFGVSIISLIKKNIFGAPGVGTYRSETRFFKVMYSTEYERLGTFMHSTEYERLGTFMHSTEYERLGTFIVGCLAADTLISVVYYLLHGNLFDACFTFIHHLVWAYLLLLYVDDEYVVRNVILGQIFIASVDLCANVAKKVGVGGAQANLYLHILNVLGRMLAGNYFIWNVYSHTANDLYLYAGAFNSIIGLTVMLTDDIMSLY